MYRYIYTYVTYMCVYIYIYIHIHYSKGTSSQPSPAQSGGEIPYSKTIKCSNMKSFILKMRRAAMD